MPPSDRDPRPVPAPTRVDISGLSPRIRAIVSLVLRDAPLLEACDSGSVEFHYSRSEQCETVKPKITLHPSNKN